MQENISAIEEVKAIEIVHDIEREFEDKYCLMQAQITLEEFVQLKILHDIIDEENDENQKQVLKEIYKEEKEVFLKSKAKLDQCLYVNGNGRGNGNHAK